MSISQTKCSWLLLNLSRKSQAAYHLPLLSILPNHRATSRMLWVSNEEKMRVQLTILIVDMFCSVLFFSRVRSEGWPHHGCAFSIYLCPSLFWLTLPWGVLSMYWCCTSTPCVVFLACMHLTLFFALSLSPDSGHAIRKLPFPSNRQHLSYGDCLEGKRGDYLTSSVLLCTSYAHLYNEQFVHGWLDRALILLGLAVFWAHLCLRCIWCYM